MNNGVVAEVHTTELPKSISGKIRRVELRQMEKVRATEGAREDAEFREEDFPELAGR